MSNMFLDKSGKLSSKRIFGFSLLLISIVWGLWGSYSGNLAMVDFAKWVLGGGVFSAVAGVAERKA